MTQDEMIELAKQAGWAYAHGESGFEPLWAFAKLVAAKERADEDELIDKAITAIKEALAQPERYPDTLISYNCKCGKTMKFESVNGIVAPQRTWVGLTDDEITELHHAIKVRLMGTYKTEDIYRAVEAKLKEKNT